MDGGHLGGRPRVGGGEALGAMKAEVLNSAGTNLQREMCKGARESPGKDPVYRVGPAKELWHHGG